MMTNNKYPYFIMHHTLTELMDTDPKINKSLDLLTITPGGPHNGDLNSYVWKRCQNKLKLIYLYIPLYLIYPYLYLYNFVKASHIPSQNNFLSLLTPLYAHTPQLLY
jgi:hypothetical protein